MNSWTNILSYKDLGKALLARSYKCHLNEEFVSLGGFGEQRPVYSCSFAKEKQYSDLLVLAIEDGSIILQDTSKAPKQPNTSVEGYNIHSNAIFDISWIPSSPYFLTASGDSTSSKWDIAEGGTKPRLVARYQGHATSVRCVEVNPFDIFMFATGGRDRKIVVWDSRCKPFHKSNELINAHSYCYPSESTWKKFLHNSHNSILGLQFQDQHKLISAGSADGLIKVWDLRKTYSTLRRDPLPLASVAYSGQSSCQGYTSLSISPDRHCVYVSCMDNVIYQYNLATAKPTLVSQYIGHVSTTYYVKSCLSPCGSFLLSGSSDNNAYIWVTSKISSKQSKVLSVSHIEPVTTLTGHVGEVTDVTWNNLGTMIVTCCDDIRHRIFRIKNINEDDFDAKLSITGRADMYKSQKSNDSSQVVDSITNNRSQCKNSCNRQTPVLNSIVLETISENIQASPIAGYSGISNMSIRDRTPKSSKATPNSMSTTTPTSQVKTPKTANKGNLLAWLSSLKKERNPNGSVTPGAENKNTRVSKRKLTDLMEENEQETYTYVSNKKTKSPLPLQPISLHSNKVDSISSLSTIDNRQSSQSSNQRIRPKMHINSASSNLTAAKMLKYECSTDTDILNSSKKDGNIEGCQPLLPYKIDITSSSILHKTPLRPKANGQLDNLIDSSSLRSPINPMKSPTGKIYESPTANLPNYVIDGFSPHARPEKPIPKNTSPNWLSSYTHQKRLKFSPKPKPAPKNSAKKTKKKIL